eukprot:jgi/Astpho2/28/fgenesh1_pm.00001_%23_5_t
MPKAADGIMQQLLKSLDENGEELVQKMKGLVLFKIDGDEWALDLRSGKGKLTKGSPEGEAKPDLTLTISDENFAKLVMGKLGPQQAFLLRKLKIGGSMGMALKLQPILDAAAPKSKM